MAGAFYATPRGAVAGALVGERLRRLWPALDGMSLLGLGFAAPYLPHWPGAARRVAVVPAPGGLAPARVGAWSSGRGSLCCTAEEDALPFPDLCFDRILLVHGLEAADNARGLLREVWRVLKDDGRLMVVAPNRMGIWAHIESTPFGHGQPYSPGQIGRLLAGSMFRVEGRDTALYVPPVRAGLALRPARVWEAGGRWLMPELAGVLITEAVKDAYAGLPVAQARRRRLAPRLAAVRAA